MLRDRTRNWIFAVFLGLVLAVLWLDALLALKRGKIVLGANYQLIAINTYGQLALLAVITALALWIAIKHLRRH